MELWWNKLRIKFNKCESKDRSYRIIGGKTKNTKESDKNIRISMKKDMMIKIHQSLNSIQVRFKYIL